MATATIDYVKIKIPTLKKLVFASFSFSNGFTIVSKTIGQIENREIHTESNFASNRRQNMSDMLEKPRRSRSSGSDVLFPRLLLGVHSEVERCEEEVPSLQFHLRFLVLQNRSLLSKIP